MTNSNIEGAAAAYAFRVWVKDVKKVVTNIRSSYINGPSTIRPLPCKFGSLLAIATQNAPELNDTDRLA